MINSGKLSSLQLEAIAYACQAHETRLPDGSRAGFFIGDGAGVSENTLFLAPVTSGLRCGTSHLLCLDFFFRFPFPIHTVYNLQKIVLDKDETSESCRMCYWLNGKTRKLFFC